MEQIQVYIPQRKNRLGQLMDTGMQGASIYGAGKGMGLFGGGSTGGTVLGSGAQKGLNLGVESTYQPYNGPEYLTDPGTTGGAAAAEGETLGAVGGPAAMAGVAGYMQMKSNNDYQKKGDKAGNAKYAERNGPESENRDALGWWNSDTISRRMDLKKQLNPKEIADLMPEVNRLPLSRSDKDSILGKLGQGLNLSKLFKIG